MPEVTESDVPDYSSFSSGKNTFLFERSIVLNRFRRYSLKNWIKEITFRR
jgi:hypothetical protein